ncbi:response regulator [Piscinibacter sp. HJYY11]|uniref:response regulator n=1 Tax=Piscinibacter sp. HJYY11 TaxID=2801333 RepID=UPI00191E84F8|nr:response regulator [Piscinibacter sp. HJYY11]MBL0726931.1 response regulator [Piscinibacter sp. HJYY11]
MKHISPQRAILLAMLVAAAVLTALAYFAWDFARQTVDAARYVAHTHEVKAVIRDLESSLYRAEAGQRAYLTTRITAYRNERDMALQSLEKGLAELSRLTTDNPAQAARVGDLRRDVAARLAVYRVSDGLLQSGSAYSAEQRIEIGAQALANIRPHIDMLVGEEDRLLAERESLQAQRTRTTVMIGAAFVALLLVVLPTTFWRMARDLKARAKAEVLVAEERAFDLVHARALTLYNAENDRQRVLDGTLALLGENPLFPVGAFYCYDEWAGGLRLDASRATPADIKRMVRLDEGPIGAAAREGRTLYLDGLQAEGAMSIETGLATVRPAGVLMCPVQYQSRLLGVLVLGVARPLADRDREFVVRMSSQLAVAINNLNHLAEMNLLTDQLRSRGEDIQRKNAELERANRMKSEFLANMSHELRTPLNAIIGFSEIMKDGLTGPIAGEQLEYVQDIHGSGKHLLSLINDILDLSKVESGQVVLELDQADPQNLAASTASVLRERASTARVRFSVQCPPDIGRLCLDMRKAKQIVYNLVSNALKFTPEGGSVTLAMERVPAERVNTVVSEPGTRVFPPTGPAFDHYLELRVVDSGIGIAPADLEQLFQAFVQIDSSLSRQYAGTGLGLTMVRRLAELHGGGVMVRSVEGKGSMFVVWLPWRKAAAQADATGQADHDATAAPHETGNGASGPARLPAGKPLVLVIEDDPRAANLMRLQLEANGYAVEFAGTAEEGLKRASELRPTAVVLDIILPGMDGWGMLARLKEQPDTSNIPVVIVSITDEAQRGFALGAAQVLVKPVTQSDLLAALAAAGLDEPHTGARVLVVDDDPKAVALVSKHLQVAGYEPVGAYGGQEALDIVRSEAPALVVLDLMMPQVSGFDVVQGLRNHPDTAGIPVIVLTAKLLTREDRALLSGKVQQVMEKTDFNSIGLLAEIKRALAGRRPPTWH